MITLPSHMTPRRIVQQQQVAADKIEYGEALLAALKLKAERQVEVISGAQPGDLVTFCRLMLDIQAVQEKLGRERYRFSLLKA